MYCSSRKCRNNVVAIEGGRGEAMQHSRRRKRRSNGAWEEEEKCSILGGGRGEAM